MEVTQAMMRAARDAEFDHHRLNRGKHDRFRPLTDGLIRAIIDAAISAIGVEDEPEPPSPPEPYPDEEPAPPRPVGRVRIVTARKPKPKRRPDR